MGDKTIRICFSCGETLGADDAFCTNCGARFDEKGDHNKGGSSIGLQLLALANAFLSVSEVSPQRFEFASRVVAQAPGQKVTIKYQAVAQLVPEKNQVLFWEKMMETLLGINAGVSHETTVQKGIDVNKKIHGQLMFGGPYGFHYDRLHRVVKAITSEQGWTYKQAMFKPAEATSPPSHEAHREMPVDISPAYEASAEGQGEALFSDTPGKRRWIPAILAGAAILIVAAALVGILSKGGKETPVAEKPKTVAVPHAVPEVQKAGSVARKPTVSAMPPSIDYNAEGMIKVKTGDMEEAAALFEKAVQAGPDNFNAWNNLGLALRKIGKNEEALKAYQRAIAIKPDFALVYKNLGIVLEQMDRKKEAAQAYLKYAELNPSAADARVAGEKAAKLMGPGKGKGIEP